MEKMTKYNFTKEQAFELRLLRAFFDAMLEQVLPKVAELVKTEKELTSPENDYMQKGLNLFNELVLSSKFKDDYLRMVDLIELESKHTRQEFINNLLDIENYELLNTMKKMNHQKIFKFLQSLFLFLYKPITKIMKPIFIELTMDNGQKFEGNLALLQRYGKHKDKDLCYVIGWNNNGGFDVKESYGEIKKLITQALSKA
jgi:hypothetical protein